MLIRLPMPIGIGRTTPYCATCSTFRKATIATWRVSHFLATQISPHESYQTSVPECDRQFPFVRVHHKNGDELSRLRFAGIRADAKLARQLSSRTELDRSPRTEAACFLVVSLDR